jgi:hypothetical protein
MASSIIIDLQFFFRIRDFSLGRLKFFRYGSSDLALPDRSLIFSHGCSEEYYPCNNFSGYYILDNGNSYSRLLSDINQAVRLFFFWYTHVGTLADGD